MVVTHIPPQKVSGSNKLIYQRLKQALSMNLRRQIFIAVCDDLCLRDCLAAHLQAELASRGHQRESLASPAASPIPGPRFVSLALNLSEPNPLAQIAQWLASHPAPKQPNRHKRPIGFQILGVEHLTRQPPAVQWSFLSYLRDIERSLPGLEFSLLLWVPRPWLCSIQQSAPEFWRWRTGVFEFAGEPTPARQKLEATRTEEISPSPHLPLSLAVNGHQNAPSPPPLNNGAIAPTLTNSKALPTVPPLKNGAIALKIKAEADKEVEETKGKDGVLTPPLRPKVAPVTPKLPSQPQQPEKISPSPCPISPLPSAAELADLILASATAEGEGVGQNLWPLETLQYIELLQEQQCSPQKLALAYEILGNFYRDRILAGDASQPHLAIAIRAYEQVLTLNSQEQGEESEACLQLWQEFQQTVIQLSLSPTSLKELPLPSPREDILNDLGTLYWMLSRHPSPNGDTRQRLSHLERSIALYQQALAATPPKAQPQTYAILHKNLGAALADLARRQHPAENWQQSVLAYQQALLHLDANAEPQHYAAALNNLGTAYWNLAQHTQPTAHLKSAITAYMAALLHYNPEAEPLNYAGVQNNLGTAYWNLAQHEPSAALLSQAVDAYQEALQYRTQELVPAAYAATQNNLGTAYWHLAQQLSQPESKAECLQQAITAYEAALSAGKHLHPSQLNFDLLAAQNNLGLAHYQLATDSQPPLNEAARRAHLEAALQHQLQACTGWYHQSAPPAGENGTGATPEAKRKSDSHQSALSSIVKTIRSFYSECGLLGQNLALSKVPGDLLPEILRLL